MPRVLIVTGARKGIGRALAEHFLARGDIVAGVSRKASDLSADGYEHFALDVADEPAVVRMVSQVKKRHGRIDGLINNAGRASMNHLLLTPADTGRSLFETNFFGTFNFLRETAKAMHRQGRGRIVNFSTVAVPLALEGEAMYAASKAAVETLTRVAARELAPFGVTVNALGPAPVDTDLLHGVPEDKIQALLDRQAVHRPATMQDVIHTVEFFLHEDSDMITGQVLYLGGVHG